MADSNYNFIQWQCIKNLCVGLFFESKDQLCRWLLLVSVLLQQSSLLQSQWYQGRRVEYPVMFFLCPHQDFFTNIEIVGSEVVEVTWIPRENHSFRKQTYKWSHNRICLSGIQSWMVRGTLICKPVLQTTWLQGSTWQGWVLHVILIISLFYFQMYYTGHRHVKSPVYSVAHDGERMFTALDKSVNILNFTGI